MGFKGSAYTHWSRAFPIQKVLLKKEVWCPEREVEPFWESLENNNRLSYFWKAVNISKPFDFPQPMKPKMTFFTVPFQWKITSNECLLHCQHKPVIYSIWMEEYKKLGKRWRGTELCFSNSLAFLSISTNTKSCHHFWIPECDFWLFLCYMNTDLFFPLLPDEWETCFSISALPSSVTGSAQP